MVFSYMKILEREIEEFSGEEFFIPLIKLMKEEIEKIPNQESKNTLVSLIDQLQDLIDVELLKK